MHLPKALLNSFYDLCSCLCLNRSNKYIVNKNTNFRKGISFQRIYNHAVQSFIYTYIWKHFVKVSVPREHMNKE